MPVELNTESFVIFTPYDNLCVSGDKLEDGDKYRHKDRSRKGRLKARLEEFGRGESGAKQTSLRDRFKAGRESEDERYVSLPDYRGKGWLNWNHHMRFKGVMLMANGD